MGWRQRLYDLLSRGEPPVVDPDAIVEVAVVPIFDGPRLVASLGDAGIEASGVESFDVVTNARTRMRIFVREADRAAALDLIG